MKKNLLLTIVFITIIFSVVSVSALNSTSNLSNTVQLLDETTSTFWGNIDVIKCGNTDLPLALPSIIRTIVNLIKILTPIALIVMGMIDMLKATIAADDKKIAENKDKFIKRLISGVIVFLVIAIIQFVVGIIAPDESGSILDCIDCMVNSADKCGEITLEVPEEGTTPSPSPSPSPSPTPSPTPTPVNPNLEERPEKVLYIGDSRTVGMFLYASLKSNENSIAKESQGLSWYQNTALSQIRSKLNTGNYYVVVNLGVNDLYNAKNYANAYNELANDYPKSKIIAVSVNPVEDSKASNNGYGVKNNDIVSFNNTLKSNLNNKVYYCDVYSRIINNFTTADGLHYTADTYKNIYSEIQKCLK